MGFIPDNGSYRRLLSFRKAEAIYDLTYRFCDRFIQKFDRTRDQMIQAARSGKQNIAEGSVASGTSKETEVKLTNVARASLEELLLDYEDYLRVHGLKMWDPKSRETNYVRDLGKREDFSYELIREFVETRPAEVVANIAICLIHQASYLLGRQIQKLESQFLEEGGIKERMAAARIEARRRK